MPVEEDCRAIWSRDGIQARAVDAMVELVAVGKSQLWLADLITTLSPQVQLIAALCYPWF